MNNTLFTNLEDHQSLEARIAACESDAGEFQSWRNNKSSALGSLLKTDYNPVTTLLGAVCTGLNATNSKVNAIQNALEERGIVVAS